MKTLLQLQEQPKKVAFTFGRFNPPTTGHEKLIQKLANQGGEIMVFPSHSQDPKKNPLPHPRKIAYMKKMFPRYSKSIMTSKARNVFEISTDLYNKGYTDITMVVGSDRVKEFDALLKKYNGVKGTHGFYDFDSISVVSAGERDPDAEGVEGMSASKMRAAAVANDFDSFEMGLPRGFRDGKKLFDDIRKAMKVNETNWSTEEILRDLYIRGEVFNINEEVQTTDGFVGKIVRKGTNYVVLETNGEFRKSWITDLIEAKKITKTKQAKGEVGDVKGTQPAKYYSKDAEGDAMSKDTKLARAKYFAKGGSRKDAPGDIDPKTGERQKTKPSQYTKKFKQMYGEQEKEPAKSDAQKDREEFKKLQKDKKVAQLQYRMAKDAEMVARLSQQEDSISENLEKFIKTNLDKIGVEYKHDYRQGTRTHIVKIDPKDHQKVTKALKHKLLHLKILIKRMDGSKIARNPNRTYKNEYVPEKYDSDKFFGGKGTPAQRTQLLKLQNKALRALGGSPKQKEIKKEIDALRKKMGMKVSERKLTDAEKDKMKKYEKDIDIKDFIDRYGEEEGKSIYYATITKMAKGEGLWDNIRKKKARIARGSGERMRKKGEKGAPTADQIKRAQESVNEMTGINVPELIKTTIHRLTHPKGYKDIVTKYTQAVAKEKEKSGHQDSNGAILSKIATQFGMDRIKPLQIYINKLVRKGQLPQMLAAELEKEGDYKQTELDNQLTHSNESKGFFSKSKSPSSKGKTLLKTVKPDLEKTLKGIDHKLEPDSSGNRIVITVDKSDVEKVKKMVGMPNLTKVVSENPIMVARGVSALSKISPSSAAGVATTVGQGLSKMSKSKTTSSKSRKQLRDELLDEKIAGLVNKSEKTGVPYGILKKSYDRGMAAWKGGHRPGATQQQWAFARVNSMLTGGKADPDLQAQIKKGGYKKKKKAKKEDVTEWYHNVNTHKMYEDRYGLEWRNKLNITYETMLSKLSEGLYDLVITEAEYQGRKVKLNDPFRLPSGSNKKFGVYVINDKGNVVKVTFGDPNMGINRDDPEARKNFRARHQCDTNPGPKYKARYWSCYQWRAGAKVDN